MKRPQRLITQTTSIALALILSLTTPVAVYADTTATASTDAPASTGTSQPTGVAANTYTFNEKTGLWENDYYTWNPVTKVTTPKDTPVYVYNSATKLWDAQIWQYHTVQGAYSLDTVSVTDPPDGAQTSGGPAPIATAPPVSQSNAAEAPASGTNNQTTGSAGSNQSNDTSSNQSTTQGASITNNVNSTATSGNAQGSNNTTVGNVSTGDATTTVNVINMIQSNTALANPNVVVFQKDIQGDVSGDLIIDPATLPQSSNMEQSSMNGLTLNSSQNNAITNNINLSSTSGNALTDNNRTAGNTSTGNAAAVANVMNMINSVVAANQSFYGTINIYGNYTGNILLPTDSLTSLLGSNGGSSTTQTTASTTADTTTNNTVNTNLGLSAISGDATASGNRTVGDTTTGNAMTNVTILNLTGHQVVASNSLLVFVNVLGTWVGVIMDAPAGATSAALTSGATAAATSAAMNGTLAADATANAKFAASTNNTITNNITASATSGNATAKDNTTAGNVTTGNATVSANIANLINNNFSLSQWFGVLFINVYGMWHGNIGTTQRASVPTGGMGSGGSMPAVASGAGTSAATSPQVFRFVSSSVSPVATYTSTVQNFDTAAPSNSSSDSSNQAVLAATMKKPTQRAAAYTVPAKQTGLSLIAIPIIAGIAGLAFVAIEKFRSLRRSA